MRQGWKKAAMALAMMMAVPAMAQDPESGGGMFSFLGEMAPMMWLLAGLVVVLVVTTALFLLNRGTHNNWETLYADPDPRSSKFDMLLAEIQGLSLRVQNGESKGYYRKIDTLGRVLLERIGHVGARKMDTPEVAAILQGGRLPQSAATQLGDIFERCRQGMINESGKLDFTAAELLRDLRQLVKQVEDAQQQKEV